MSGENAARARISYLAVASLALALLWYVGWGLALAIAVQGLRDPQGWNWLLYSSLGVFGMPVPVLSTLLGVWALGRIRARPGSLAGDRLATIAIILCSLVWPIWSITPEVVNLWK
jgi:hypothetical protein